MNMAKIIATSGVGNMTFLIKIVPPWPWVVNRTYLIKILPPGPGRIVAMPSSKVCPMSFHLERHFCLILN